MKTIVVGAGLAGLTCAKVLTEGGAEVVLFEASDGVGGRVRTDEKDGFLLDRGFQVYFTAYPAARRHLDHEKLDLRRFDPGAVVCRDGRRTVLSDPRRDPAAIVPSLLSDAATISDKVRTLGLASAAVSLEAEAVSEVPGEDSSSQDYLRGFGFSEKFVDEFFRPFYGGILLDRSLGTSARVLRFTFKMLATGETVVPARGMGEIPAQLASHLPEGVVNLNSPAERLLYEDERVVGVEAAGEEHEADAVVIAADAPVAGEISGEPVPEGYLGQLCIYYAGGGIGGKKISLNAEDGRFLNNVVQISNVSGSYAPDGQGLVCAVALGGMDLPDEEVYRRGVEDITSWYPVADLRPLAIYRIPYAQFSQPPGVHRRLPQNHAKTPGLVLAGEYTEDSSINGSMLSGEKAAEEVLGSWTR
ncbi:MAG: NAD(P)/FAD-dependent oxidoreductase [Rubrobacteraceae bacterium]